MVKFFKFWWRAVRSAFAVGWLVFGIVSTLLPSVITFIQKHFPELATVQGIKWMAGNQVEIQFYIGALVLLIYLAYAPDRLYKEQGAKLAALEMGKAKSLKNLENFRPKVSTSKAFATTRSSPIPPRNFGATRRVQWGSVLCENIVLTKRDPRECR